MSKCGGRLGMPIRSTPPDLALGSGALSLNVAPSYLSGIGSASAGPKDNPQAPVARAAPLRTSRRVRHSHGRGNCTSLIKFLMRPFGTGHGVSESGSIHDLSNQIVSSLTTSYTPK